MKFKLFTLIELLVIISVFLILTSLISPSFQRIKQSADILHCKNSLKTLYLNHMLYASDNDGTMVINYTQDGQGVGRWGRFWISNPDFLAGVESTSTLEFFEKIKCPSLSTASVIGNSYGINTDPIGFRDGSQMRFHAIQKPTTKIFMTEGSDFHLNRSFSNYISKWDDYGDSWYWAVSYRHQENANLTFFDGHVNERHKMNVYFPNDSDARKELWEINRDAFTLKAN